ncbi:hypothetical protein [Campylobacter upsaliensis]|nr:hypothetical protein [Campylobacter upsaliensis]
MKQNEACKNELENQKTEALEALEASKAEQGAENHGHLRLKWRS